MNSNESPDEATIFEEALAAKSEFELEALLDMHCGADVALRQRVLSLLESYTRGEYLERLQVEMPRGELEGARVGNFEVMELIGQGGMGDVYSARRNDRREEIVALKVIKPGMDTRQVISRFNLERDALRKFNHPNIASFIDSGVDESGRLYFAMELVQGISIVDYCDHHRLSIESRLRLFLDVCSAVHHAHGYGIIHRDLKPQNVLVAQRDGVAVVKVIDFGVAKALSNDNWTDSRLTGALQWIGTPKYVSPEQLTWSSDVDARADVFSLGVLLYELLTGTTPSKFDEPSDLDLARLRSELLKENVDYCSQRVAAYKPQAALQHAENRAIDIRDHIRTLKGDLDRIVEKALEVHRHRRYATAIQLADDIRGHLAGSSLSLEPLTLFGRWQRWKRRNPIAAARAIRTGIGLAIVCLLLIAGREIWRANDARRVLEHASFVQNIQSASQSIFSGDTASARNALQEYLADDQNRYANHFAPRYLQSLCIEPSQTILGHETEILDMDMSENRNWLVSVDRGGDIILWDRKNGKEAHRVNPSDKETTRVRFRPQGKMLATAGRDALIRLWDPENLEPLGSLKEHQITINGLAWSPNGDLLATGDREGFVYIWDVDKQLCITKLPKQPDTVRCIEWSPDGKYLAIAVKNVGVQLWETDGWSKVAEFPESNGNGALAIAFSPDSKNMVFGGYGRMVSFVDLTTLRVEQTFATQHNIYSIQFGRNLEVFAGESPGIMQLFQRSMTLNSWVPTRLVDLASTSSAQRAICFDEDADVMLTAAEKQKSIEAYHLSQILGYQTKAIPTVCVGPISQLGLKLLSDAKKGVSVQDDYERIKSLNARASPLCAPAYSKFRQLIAIATIDKGVNLVSATSLQTVGRIDNQTDVSSLQFSRTGQRLSICKLDGTVDVLDLRTMSSWTTSELEDANRASGAFSPSDSLFVSGVTHRNTLTCFDEATGRAIRSVNLLNVFENLCFHPQGKYLVVGEMGWISVWASDLSQNLWRAPLTKNGVPGIVVSICFSPVSDSVAVLLRDGTVELWDMQSRLRLFAVQTPTLSDSSDQSRRWMSFQDDSTLWVSSEDGKKIFVLNAKNENVLANWWQRLAMSSRLSPSHMQNARFVKVFTTCLIPLLPAFLPPKHRLNLRHHC